MPKKSKIEDGKCYIIDK